MKKAVAEYRAAKRERDRTALRARRHLSRAVKHLLSAGFSMRDAAEVLGVSHQRVHQISKQP